MQSERGNRVFGESMQTGLQTTGCHDIDMQDEAHHQELSGEVLNACIIGTISQSFRSNLIFWIVLGCGIARFGRRGL